MMYPMERDTPGGHCQELYVDTSERMAKLVIKKIIKGSEEQVVRLNGRVPKVMRLP